MVQHNALPQYAYDDCGERRARMRALQVRHRDRGMRRHMREGLRLGWYMIRLTLHAAGFGLLLAGLLAVMYFLG